MHTKPRPATAQWAQFLRNHDGLDLGRLTKKQRDAVLPAFGPEPNMQLYKRGFDAVWPRWCRAIAGGSKSQSRRRIKYQLGNQLDRFPFAGSVPVNPH